MRPLRTSSSMLLALSLLVVPLFACTPAELAVEPRLADAAEPFLVTGANPRVWNQRLGFGPWSTAENHDGTEFSWAFSAFGVSADGAHRPYGFVLRTPGGDDLEVACHTDELRLFRGSFEADVTAAFTPALACAFRPTAGGVANLTLAVKANDYRGELRTVGGRTFEVRSLHHFAGSPLRNPEPVGYEVARGDRVVAAVETVNRGRVWVAPELTGAERDEVAAAAAAFLLFGGGEV